MWRSYPALPVTSGQLGDAESTQDCEERTGHLDLGEPVIVT